MHAGKEVLKEGKNSISKNLVFTFFVTRGSERQHALDIGDCCSDLHLCSQGIYSDDTNLHMSDFFSIFVHERLMDFWMFVKKSCPIIAETLKAAAKCEVCFIYSDHTFKIPERIPVGLLL